MRTPATDLIESACDPRSSRSSEGLVRMPPAITGRARSAVLDARPRWPESRATPTTRAPHPTGGPVSGRRARATPTPQKGHDEPMNPGRRARATDTTVVPSSPEPAPARCAVARALAHADSSIGPRRAPAGNPAAGPGTVPRGPSPGRPGGVRARGDDRRLRS